MDGLPEAPEDISDEVRAVWDFTVEQVSYMRTLSIGDRDALLTYCEAVVAHRRASALLAKSDILTRAGNGTPIVNPVLRVQRDAANVIRQLAREFGLTPSARRSIRVGEANKPQNSAERLLS